MIPTFLLRVTTSTITKGNPIRSCLFLSSQFQQSTRQSSDRTQQYQSRQSQGKSLNSNNSFQETTPSSSKIQSTHSIKPSKYSDSSLQANLNESNNLPNTYQKNSVSNEDRRMVYCHALPNDWDESQLRAYFDPNSKNIATVKLLRNRIGGYTGRALIEFNNAKIAEEYLAKHGDSFIESTDVLQRIIMKPFELKTKRTRLQAEKTMKEVYLANLPYEATSDEIYALASDFGEVAYVDMPLAFDGSKNRGYCIVKFASPQQAYKFQNYFENETLYGRKIRDPSIKNANLRANKELFKSLLND